ncbi:TPA: hypothetical protein QDZ84_003435 [Shewanella algae]|uniref:hypothetical protein n=1 Tax=Shewanella TaxID=22 RepID=UPI0014312CF8|nr:MULTISPECIES: hypothetical protein [Shewanella]NJI86981.1 hypothetical protein [Shewanella sp. Iso12]HDS1208396.1 hypothetical protein [Shewanella algae]
MSDFKTMGALEREKLSLDVEITLSGVPDLKPFLPVWRTLVERTEGVDKEFDLVPFIYQRLSFEVARNNLTTETFFITTVLESPVFQKNVVSLEDGCVWDPLIEPFDKFKCKHGSNIVFTEKSSIRPLDEVFSWIIEQCDWSKNTSENGYNESHRLH